MSINLKFVNFDQLLQTNKGDKVFVNTVDVYNRHNKEILDKLILSNYTDDNISIIPSCLCGDIKGEYYIGTHCNNCGTTVKPTVEDNLSFLLWVKRVQGVQKFISPVILKILTERYKITKPKVPIIPYLIMTDYKIDRKQQGKNMEHIEKLDHILKQNNIKRGYNNFVDNFFNIISLLEEHFRKKTPNDNYNFLEFLRLNEHSILSDSLPFPNKVVFSMESNELGRFFDDSLVKPINVIRRLTGIDIYNKSTIVKQNKVAKSLLELSDFYEEYIKTVFFSKPGLVRQHISSTRSHFTARAVITSLYGIHRYDEIHLPWSLSCTLFREHIINRLLKYGLIYKDAVSLLLTYNRTYNELIDKIFQEVIAEAGGVPCFLNRNPSLHRGSIQTVRITKIKTDTEDNTISLSPLIAPSFNADFDGDELNITLILTKTVSDNMGNFDPHHNILGLAGVNGFTNNIKFPKTIVGTLNNWLS